MEIKETDNRNYNEMSLDDTFSIIERKSGIAADSLYEQASTGKISQERFNELFFELLGNKVLDESKRKNDLRLRAIAGKAGEYCLEGFVVAKHVDTKYIELLKKHEEFESLKEFYKNDFLSKLYNSAVKLQENNIGTAVEEIKDAIRQGKLKETCQK